METQPLTEEFAGCSCHVRSKFLTPLVYTQTIRTHSKAIVSY